LRGVRGGCGGAIGAIVLLDVQVSTSFRLNHGVACSRSSSVLFGRLTRNLHICIVALLRVFDDPPKALRVHGVFEFPESVSRQVRAGEELAPPGQSEGFPF